jgi:modulator of FtsH protease
MQTIDATDSIQVRQTTTASLLAKVLWITTVGFLFTAFGSWIAPPTLGISYFVVIIVNFALIFAISYAARKSNALGLTLFYVFTTLMGVQISPIINQTLHTAGGQTIVLEAALTTALGMALMGVIAEFANFNYMKVGRIAFFALIGLIVLGLLGSFVFYVNPTIYAWLTLIIFSVFLLVDFMRIRDRQFGAVQMALSIYLDALNIFLALLRIFGGGRGSRR